MKKVDRQPDQKPVDPRTSGHDAEKSERQDPAAFSKKTDRKPEEFGRPADRTTPDSEPRSADRGGFDNERSDRSSGRPVQLPDQETTEDGADDEPRRELGRDRQSAGGSPKR
jgi:hypothetical protein